MTLAKARETTLFASGTVAAGLTKATASPGSTIDLTTYVAGEILYTFTNSTSAPAGTPTCVFQVANTSSGPWADKYTVYGDNVASSVNTGVLPIDLGDMYLRALPFGHTTNPITFAAECSKVTV